MGKSRYKFSNLIFKFHNFKFIYFFLESCKLTLEERKGGREDWKRNGGR